MATSEILITIVKILHPFTLLFGAYIIINGDLSPGGGFQGGAIIATAYLLINFIKSDTATDIPKLIRTEKYLFLAVIIVGSLSLLTRGEFFTNFMMVEDSVDFKRFFLVVVNTLIGLKVAVGLVIIFTIFMGEGKS